jgi:hypothetical protein
MLASDTDKRNSVILSYRQAEATWRGSGTKNLRNTSRINMYMEYVNNSIITETGGSYFATLCQLKRVHKVCSFF